MEAMSSPGADLGAGLASFATRLRFFPSFSIQETLVMIGMGAGTGLGMEIPANFHGVPWAWSKVGIWGVERCWFGIGRCCVCVVPQCELCTPIQQSTHL